MLGNEIITKPQNRLAGDDGFKGKTILITGVSGFVGKVLLEKMLRSCPLIKKIYVIIRDKKRINPQNRLKQMFANSLYDLLKKTEGEEILQKVIAVPGDISELNLGLSEDNWKMLTEEVEIIFHLAATIRFDDPLKKAVLLNTRGTKLLLNLAKKCKKLLVFAYVSTAYCHPQEKVLYEKMYSPPADPDDIIKVVEILNEDMINLIAKRMKGNFPNTYSYTKALAEGLVNKEMDNLPVIILRPSVIIPIWLEPIPGWTDNLNGPTGLLVAAGKGLCRTMYCNSKACADFVPVDLVANTIMLTTYDYMVYKKRRIFNLTSSERVKVSWSEIIDIGRRLATVGIPFNWVIWYPGGSIKSSKLLHNICVVLFHYIPALFLDFFIILTGHKPVLWKIQRRISKGFELFEYYANNQWDFISENLVKISELTNETEKEIYKADEVGLNLDQYFYDSIHECRLNILKESDESLPTARRHLMIMWAIDRICKFLILIGFGYLLIKYFL